MSTVKDEGRLEGKKLQVLTRCRPPTYTLSTPAANFTYRKAQRVKRTPMPHISTFIESDQHRYFLLKGFRLENS